MHRLTCLILLAASLAAADRKESAYTITSVMQFAKPYRLADMTDDYQEARLVSEDADSLTVEITYYPLHNPTIGENPNWRRDYAGMTEYLRPTVTENWDAQMRADLIAALRADGIDPDSLTDRDLVTQVSRWLMKRSHYNSAFAIWDVDFPGGVPRVVPALRAAFDKEKPSPTTTDQWMFDHEVLGRQMFYNKVHGSCTSSSVLMTTVMRALGIPTRIVFFVPPADGNDSKQVEMLLDAVHHNGIRRAVRHGMPGGGGDFSNHLYNEVFVGNRWVRLNYDVLGQKTVDEDYLGLMTHIFTTASLADVSMAETWGSRMTLYPKVGPTLSSVNPYRLLKVSDHFGTGAQIPNPPVDDEELRRVTIIEALWKDALPAAVDRLKTDPTGSDFYIGIQEYIPHYRLQMREFARHAGHHFVLSAEGHPDVPVTLTPMKYSAGSKEGRRYQLFGVRVDAEARALLSAGVDYRIRPVNTSETYNWSVRDGLTIQGAALVLK